MKCPNCNNSKNIFNTKYKIAIRNSKNEVIGIKPQYSCLNCCCEWDVVIRKEGIK